MTPEQLAEQEYPIYKDGILPTYIDIPARNYGQRKLQYAYIKGYNAANAEKKAYAIAFTEWKEENYVCIIKEHYNKQEWADYIDDTMEKLPLKSYTTSQLIEIFEKERNK